MTDHTLVLPPACVYTRQYINTTVQSCAGGGVV